MGQQQSSDLDGRAAAPTTISKPVDLNVKNSKSLEKKTALEIPKSNIRIIHVDPTRREGIVGKHGYIALKVGQSHHHGNSPTRSNNNNAHANNQNNNNMGSQAYDSLGQSGNQHAEASASAAGPNAMMQMFANPSTSNVNNFGVFSSSAFPLSPVRGGAEMGSGRVRGSISEVPGGDGTTGGEGSLRNANNNNNSRRPTHRLSYMGNASASMPPRRKKTTNNNNDNDADNNAFSGSQQSPLAASTDPARSNPGGEGEEEDAPEFSDEIIKELKTLRQELRDWKKKFKEKNNGRMPGRADMFNNPEMSEKAIRIREIEEIQMMAGAAKFMEGGAGASLRQARARNDMSFLAGGASTGGGNNNAQSIAASFGGALVGSMVINDNGDWDAMLGPSGGDHNENNANNTNDTTAGRLGASTIKRSRTESAVTEMSSQPNTTPGIMGIAPLGARGTFSGPTPTTHIPSSVSRLTSHRDSNVNTGSDGAISRAVRRRGVQKFFCPQGDMLADRIFFQDRTTDVADIPLEVKQWGEYEIEENEIYDVAGVRREDRLGSRNAAKKRERAEATAGAAYGNDKFALDDDEDDDDPLATYQPESAVLDALITAIQAPIQQFRYPNADDIVEGISDTTLIDKLKDFRSAALHGAQSDFDRNYYEEQQAQIDAGLLVNMNRLGETLQGGSNNEMLQRLTSTMGSLARLKRQQSNVVGGRLGSAGGSRPHTGSKREGAEQGQDTTDVGQQAGNGNEETDNANVDTGARLTRNESALGATQVGASLAAAIGNATTDGADMSPEAIEKAKTQIRKRLHKQLNEWKANFEAENGRPPEVYEMARDPTIREAYGMYTQLKKDSKATAKKKKEEEEEAAAMAAQAAAEAAAAAARATAGKLTALGDSPVDSSQNIPQATAQVKIFDSAPATASDDAGGNKDPFADRPAGWDAGTRLSAVSPRRVSLQPIGAASIVPPPPPAPARQLTEDEKKELKVLNKRVRLWKKNFKEHEGRNPNRTDIRHSEEIRDDYFRVKELQAIEAGGVGGGGASDNEASPGKADVDHIYEPLPIVPTNMSLFEAISNEENIDRRDVIADELIAWRQEIENLKLSTEGVNTALGQALIALRREQNITTRYEPRKAIVEDDDNANTEQQLQQKETTAAVAAASSSIPPHISPTESPQSPQDNPTLIATARASAIPHQNEQHQGVVPHIQAHQQSNAVANTQSNQDAKRKKQLTKELNAWKAAFKATHGRDPFSKDIKKDPSIAPIYEEWLTLGKAPGGGEENVPQQRNSNETAAAAPPAVPPNPYAHLTVEEQTAKKKELLRKLNAWKAQFKAEYNRDPLAKDMEADAQMKPTHDAFKLLKELESHNNNASPPYNTATNVGAGATAGSPAAARSGSLSPPSNAPLNTVPLYKRPLATLTEEEANELVSRRHELADNLKEWRSNFTEQMGRVPTQSDIKADGEMSKLFAEYNAIPADVLAKHAKAVAEQREKEAAAADRHESEDASESTSRKKKKRGSISVSQERTTYNAEDSVSVGAGGGATPRESIIGINAAQDVKRKKHLTKQLNAWKKAFSEVNNGRKPKPSDIEADPTIAPVYHEWSALKAAGAASTNNDEEESPQHHHHNEDGGSEATPSDPSPRRVSMQRLSMDSPSNNFNKKLLQEHKRTKILAKELNVWKEKFKAENGREATKGDITADESIAPLYAEFKALKKGNTASEAGDNEGNANNTSASVSAMLTPAAMPLEPSGNETDVHNTSVSSATAAPKPPHVSLFEPSPMRLRAPSNAATAHVEGPLDVADVEATTPTQQSLQKTETAVFTSPPQPPPPFSAPPAVDNHLDQNTTVSESPARNKKQLAKELQAWKEKFKADNGRDPTKGDISNDPEAGPMYRQFQEMKKEEEGAKDDQSSVSRKESVAARKESVSPAGSPQEDDKTGVSTSRSKKQLAKELQAWKEKFKADNGRDPTKGDISNDPEAGPMYRQFQEMKKEEEGKVASRNHSFAAPPAPVGESDPQPASPPNPVGEEETTNQTDDNVAPSKPDGNQEEEVASVSPYVLEQQQQLHNRKKELNKALNEWKTNFQTENGRAPKGSDIQQSPEMAAMYDELRQIKAQLGAE